MGLLKSKLMLRLTLAVSIFGVAVGAVSTAAWFQINNSVAPTQTAATKELQTNATVYQENAHANDDTYQTSPINDYAGTLSYDHAQGGTATNYYIREYNSSGEEVHTTQMYTNTGNQTDKAVIFNYSFTTANTYCFKVYNASDNTYIGHNSLVCDSSIASHFVARTAGEVDDNIKTGEANTFYDIYVDKDSHVYIKVHGEVTTSDEMGNETGWYICGNDSSDSNSSLDGMDGTVTTGISMYVNAAKANEGSEDIAYYAGLRVSPGDEFWIMSGDDLETHYYVAEEGSSDLFTYSDGVITAGADALGYYTVALNHSHKIYLNPWDGMEVNGSTRYTVNSMADQSNQKQGVERKARRNAAVYDGTKLNEIGFQNHSSDGYGHYWMHIYGGASETTWPGHYLGTNFGTDYTLWFDASAYVGWTNIIITRRSSSSTDSSEWNRLEYSVTANTKNFFKVDGWDANGGGLSKNSEERRATIKVYKVLNGTKQGSVAATDYCWNSNTYTPSIGATPSQTNYTFNGWYTNEACTSSWTSGTNVTKDTTLYAKFTGNQYSITYKDKGGGAFSGSSSHPANYNYGIGATLGNATKNGYTFGGWYTNSTCTSGLTTSISTTATGNKTFYAKWTPNSYTITYKDGGNTDFSGTHETGYPTSHTYGTATTLKSASKDNYRFDGWYTDSACPDNKKVTSLGATAYTANITLYAKWTPAYTVTFNMQGHGSQVVSQGVVSGEKVIEPSPAPSCDDYTFGGWYKEAGCVNAWNFATDTVSGATTLYAKWTIKTFTVTIVSNNEDYGTVDVASVASVPYGTVITTSSNTVTINGTTVTATKETNTAEFTYAFTGWTNGTATVTSALTVTANFTRTTNTYTVTITRNNTSYGTLSGGTTSGNNKIIASVPYGTSISKGTGGNVNKITVNGTTVTANAAARVDRYYYAFSSWSIPNNATTVTGNITITANFTQNENKYTITWKNYDGTTLETDSNVAYGAEPSYDGSTPTRASAGGYAYAFTGWDPNPPATLSGSTVSLTYTAQFIATGGFITGTFNSWSKNNADYALTTNPSNENEIMKTSVTMYKGDEFKIVGIDSTTHYGWNNRKEYNGGSAYEHQEFDKYCIVAESSGDCNFKVQVSGVYSFYVVKANLISGSDSKTDAIWVQLDTVGSITYTTKIKYGSSQETVNTYTNYIAGENFTVPALPTKDIYGYKAATHYHNNSSGTGDEISPDDVLVTGNSNVTLYAIYDTADSYIYYFDLSNDAASGLRSGFKVNAWIPNPGSGSAQLDATQVTGNVNGYWWKVTVPYNANLRMQLYVGSNNQGDQYFVASSTNGDVLLLEKWSSSGGSGTGGPWLGRASNGTVQTVNIYKSKSRNGVITDGSTIGDSPYYLLNNETWNCSVLTSVLSGAAETGWTTPTVVHKDSNNGATTYNSSSSFNATSNVSLYAVYVLEYYTFNIKQSTQVNDDGSSYAQVAGKSASWNVEDASATKTITGVHLEQGKLWYIEDNKDSHGGAEYAGHILFDDISLTSDKISISVSGITAGTKAAYTNYFVKQSNNIRNYIGGTYTIVINCSTRKITAITLTAVDTSDFVILGKGGAFNNRDFNIADAFVATGTSASGTSIDYSFGSKHLFLQDQFKAAKTYNSGSGTHSLSNTYSGDTAHFYINSSDNNNIASKLDTTVTFTVRFVVTTGAFSIVFSSYTETVHTSIDFKHARDAGIYIEITSTLKNGNPDWTASTTRMMHTTSNATYTAQEAPITLTNGQYFRIFRTHSNTTAANNTLTTDAAIRAATETYYYTLANTPTGFSQGVSYISTAAAAALHRWTISLVASNNTVHIDEYTGASTQSTEHHVPYYLVGRGVPGSDIRGCDYTIDKGIQLYTWGNNVSNMGCYVGAYGTNTSPSNYKGTGINLKAGDVFKFTTASNLITYSQTTHDDSYYTLTAAGQVTIKTSGLYRVYLTGGEGTEVINIEYVSAGDSWSRSGNIVARGTSGASLIGVNGNVFSFGGNLDYSLLDAYGAAGYTFVIHLQHVASSVGNLTYKITNSNSYQIKVAQSNNTYNAGNSYTNEQTINASANNSSLTRTISTGTNNTCLRVTIPTAQAQSMISSGTFTFSMNVEYIFVETTIS